MGTVSPNFVCGQLPSGCGNRLLEQAHLCQLTRTLHQNALAGKVAERPPGVKDCPLTPRLPAGDPLCWRRRKGAAPRTRTLAPARISAPTPASGACSANAPRCPCGLPRGCRRGHVLSKQPHLLTALGWCVLRLQGRASPGGARASGTGRSGGVLPFGRTLPFALPLVAPGRTWPASTSAVPGFLPSSGLDAVCGPAQLGKGSPV